MTLVGLHLTPGRPCSDVMTAVCLRGWPLPTFLATAIGFIAAAIIANGSIAGAVGSPGLMLAAALFSAVAVAVLAAAEGLVSAYCTCLQAAGGDAAECAGGSCDSLRAAHRWSHHCGGRTSRGRLCRRWCGCDSICWGRSDDLHHGHAGAAVPTHPNGDRVAHPASAMRRRSPAARTARPPNLPYGRHL